MILLLAISGRCLQNRSKENFLKCTKFNTVVRWVEYNEETDDFTVKVKDLIENRYTENNFTHIIVASGLFGTAYLPSFPGLDQFRGVVIHAKDVRRSKHFTGKRVLLIGSRYSAYDLSLQFIKYGAKTIIISYQSEPMGVKWTERIKERLHSLKVLMRQVLSLLMVHLQRSTRLCFVQGISYITLICQMIFE